MSKKPSSKKSSKKTKRNKCYNTMPAVMQFERWISAEVLGRFIRDCSGLDFSVQAVRTTLLSKLANLRYEAPVSKYVRFPKNDAYFLLSKNSLDNAILDFQTALSYRDRRGEVSLSDGKDIDHSEKRDKKDAIVAAAKRLSEVCKVFSDKTSVYTRSTFEREFPWDYEELSSTSESDYESESDDETQIGTNDANSENYNVLQSIAKNLDADDLLKKFSELLEIKNKTETTKPVSTSSASSSKKQSYGPVISEPGPSVSK